MSNSKKAAFFLLGFAAVFVIFMIILAVGTTPADNSNNANNSGPYSYLIGKEAVVIKTDLHIRSDASPTAPQVGVFFMNTKIKILNAKKSDTGTLWYQIKAVSYGCSSVNNRCGKDKSNDLDTGWAYSEYVQIVR